MKITRKDKKWSYSPNSQKDIEASLVVYISNTGREQIKKRRKAGLSVYFAKDGRIIEMKPDKKEIVGGKIESRWVKLDKNRRSLVLK